MSIIANLSEASQEAEKPKKEASHDARALRELAAQLEDSLKSDPEDRQLESLTRELFGKEDTAPSNSEIEVGLQAMRNLSQTRQKTLADLKTQYEQTDEHTDHDSRHSPNESPSHDSCNESLQPSQTEEKIVPEEKPARSRSPEKLEVLAGSVTSMQASIAELRMQLENKRQDAVPEQATTNTETELPARLEEMRKNLQESISTGLNERIKQNEQRSVSAIKELGTQLVRANSQMEEQQKRILSGIDSRLDMAARTQNQNFDQALTNIQRRLDAVSNESRQSLEPLRNTMASLARRIDTLETRTNPPAQPPPAAAAHPARPPDSASQPSADRNTEQSSYRYASSPPHVSQPPGAGGEDCLRSVREKLKTQEETANTLEAGLSSYEKRNGLPIVAASALALAVAGGGALSSMRGKENAFDRFDEAPSSTAMARQVPAPAAPRITIEKTARQDITKLVQAGASETKSSGTAGSADNASPVAAKYSSLDQAVQDGFPRALYEQGLKELTEGQKLQGAIKMQRAAEAGLALAQYRMSKMYERGEGVPRSISRARSWAELAAKGGNVRAMHDMAVFYAEGEGGSQDYAVAIDWFRKAGSFGLTDSQYNLGVLYEQGLGVTRDLQEAAYWYEMAGMSGDTDGLSRARELGSKHKELNLEAIRARASNFKMPSPNKIANGHFGAAPWKSQTLMPQQNPDTQAVAVEENKKIVSTVDIAEIQVLLTRLGYSPGLADGVAGPGTRRAIMAFEYRNKITPSGQVSAKTQGMLREQVFGIVS